MFNSFIAIFCEDAEIPENGQTSYSWTIETDNGYPFGTVANISCGPGFSLVGNNTRICSANNTAVGVWRENSPTCDGKFNNIIILCYLI